MGFWSNGTFFEQLGFAIMDRLTNGMAQQPVSKNVFQDLTNMAVNDEIQASK